MRKIGIFTINDYNNYGNRLQNYATQEVLKSLGFSVETVINSTQYNTRENSINKIEKLKELTIKDFFSKSLSKVWYKVNKENIHYKKAQRIKSFKNFTSSYISETDYSIAENNIPENLSNKYDYFVTGSDQVWNPVFRYGSSVDFLTFAPKNKRIAYSPSFGIAEIPSNYIDDYKVWLSEMHRLSVRENAGAKIIKDLTGRNATVLLDPTLMLTKEKWLSISKKASNKTEKEYLLTYFLGDIPKKIKRRISNIAADNNLQIINLADPKDVNTYITGPSEFIDYIHSASVFCTDSFHGVVFSVLMDTPFIIFDRKGNLPSMNSRIDTLLTTLKLQSRLAQNVETNKQIFEADYSHVASILKDERKKAIDYLKEAMQV